MNKEANVLASVYYRACNGNDSAFSFLCLFNRYCHAIDDIVDGVKDGKPRDAEFIINTFAHCCTAFSHPFYQANSARLQPVVYLLTNAYADSVKWEKSPKDSHRAMADVLRLCGNEMVFAIALICGGFDHLRAISAEIREDSWEGHHMSGMPV